MIHFKSSLYEKNTFLNDNFPSTLLGVIPLSELDISNGLVVISFNLLSEACPCFNSL